jgi:hypothetical protein
MMKGKTAKSVKGVMTAVVLFGASIIAAPQLLAFPYQTQIGTTTVYSEQPVNVPALAQLLNRTEKLLKASSIYQSPPAVRIFLTDGGWRWRLLSLTNHGSFALTRAFSDLVSQAVLVNRSNHRRDLVYNGGKMGGQRTLSGVIAHERTHMMLRRHFGQIRAAGFKRWKSEGYCDHVAQESALTAEEVARLNAKGQNHPALLYYDGRQKVEAILARNGGSVDALFDSSQ